MKTLIEQEYTHLTDSKRGEASLQKQKAAKIWAVGGGKGGVGKSLVTANTAIALARLGYRVIAADLDLGGANLHTCLGVDIPKRTMSDFVNQRAESLEEIATPTPVKNLSLISGAQDAVGIANLKKSDKQRVIESLRRDLSCDYLILDLGAGTSNHTLDFFLAAEQGILTLLPEPTSIENTYRFIKSAYYRRLKSASDFLNIHDLIDLAMDKKNEKGIRTPSDLVREVSRINPEVGQKLVQEIGKFRPKIVINQVRTQADIDIGFSIKSVCKKYFGIHMDYLGYLDYDSAVWQSVRRKRPLLLEFPNSNLVSHFDRILHRLLGKQRPPLL
jgi:flagellar biosynthesis protein FlhG